MTIRDRIDNGDFENKVRYPSGLSVEERKELMPAYRQGEKDAKTAFGIALAHENHVRSIKSAILFDLAWQYGHSGGLQSVADYYEDMVALL